MKYIGFIRRFDLYNPSSNDWAETLTENKIDEDLRTLIIDYLSSGKFLLGWMSYLHEQEGMGICDHDYYTDGYYIEPAYYMCYLHKYNIMSIESEFINHVKENNFLVPDLSNQQLNTIEKLYFAEHNAL